MHKLLTLLACCLGLAGSLAAQDKTLRLDYIFSGTDKSTEISLAQMKSLDGWYGRRVNRDHLQLAGNGQITVRDALDGQILYTNSFSTLFQEWQNSEEATKVRKSFENVFLVPMPERPAEITVELFDSHRRPSASIRHTVDPADILVRPVGLHPTPHRILHQAGDSREKIDIAIVAEGYTAEEAELFYSDARTAMESIWSHEPFKSMQDRFNIVAVAPASNESGVSIPHNHDWKDTALGSHFDTFYSDRYLTTLNLFRLHDVLAGIPYEHIIILANTDNYGGGGIFNSYVLTAAHNRFALPVVVHEFGHSFGGLADEYYYDDQYEESYHADAEPWEPNITTLFDFDSKWKGMMGKNGVGLHEGGGYQSKGVFRPCDDCRMKTNQYPTFCPVCEQAIRDIINFYTIEKP